MSEVQQTQKTKALYFSIQTSKGPVQLLSSFLTIDRKRDIVQLILGQYDKTQGNVVPFTSVDFGDFQRVHPEEMGKQLLTAMKAGIAHFIYQNVANQKQDQPMVKHLIKYLESIMEITPDSIDGFIINQANELRSIYAFILAYGATPEELESLQSGQPMPTNEPVPLPALEEGEEIDKEVVHQDVQNQVGEEPLSEEKGMLLSQLLKDAQQENKSVTVDTSAIPAPVENTPSLKSMVI